MAFLLNALDAVVSPVVDPIVNWTVGKKIVSILMSVLTSQLTMNHFSSTYCNRVRLFASFETLTSLSV